MHAPFISACLLSFDSEETIELAVRSVRGHVDEVVVYDTGSTDGTLEILERVAAADGAPLRVVRAGAELRPALYEDGALRDVAFARRLLFELPAADATWLLWLDSDDEIVIECDLRAEAAALPADVDALLVRYVCAAGKEIWKPRLFRRGRLHWLGRVHGQMLPAEGSDGYDFVNRWRHVGPDRFVVIHRGDDAYDAWKVRILRDEEEEATADGEDDPRVLLYLGHDARLREEPVEALSYFVRAALQFDPGFSPLALSEIAALLGSGDRPWAFSARAPALCDREVGDWVALLAEGVAAQFWGHVTSVAGVATALVDLGFQARGAEIATELVPVVESQPAALNHFELPADAMLGCLESLTSGARNPNRTIDAHNVTNGRATRAAVTP
jgi:hypothetical protein